MWGVGDELSESGRAYRPVRGKPALLQAFALVEARAREDDVAHRVGEDSVVRPLVLGGLVEEVVLKRSVGGAARDRVKHRVVGVVAQRRCDFLQIQPVRDAHEEGFLVLGGHAQTVEEEAVVGDFRVGRSEPRRGEDEEDWKHGCRVERLVVLHHCATERHLPVRVG